MMVSFKLLPILLLFCFLFSSCEKISDGGPASNYRYEVSCSECTISVESGYDVQTYYVQGYLTIPYNRVTVGTTVSLWTDADSDKTLVVLKGGGYDRTIFNGYLYYNAPIVEISVSL
jgi:hypothetical protein